MSSNKELPHERRALAGDKVLWIILSVMFIISILVVYSSTAKMAYDINNPSSTRGFLIAQIAWLALSIVSVFVVSLIKSKVFFRIAPLFFWGSVALTFAALVIGQVTNGAARWLTIPFINVSVQPSELLKVGIILYLARILSKRQDSISQMKIVPTIMFWRWGEKEQQEILRGGFRSILLPIIIACTVILTAHTSSALIVGFIAFVMLLIGRVNWRELGKILLWVTIAFTIYSFFGIGRSHTASSRVGTWIETLTTSRYDIPVNELTDTERSMIAINVGGLMGQGAGQSAMRVEIMHPESDYAYAFFVEEYGLLMGLLILLFYLWIFFRSINIYKSGCPPFSGLMILGIALLITSQALLHIMVTINLAPETGQTLPIISRGGTSLLITSLSMGIILSVSRQREEIRSLEANKA